MKRDDVAAETDSGKPTHEVSVSVVSEPPVSAPSVPILPPLPAPVALLTMDDLPATLTVAFRSAAAFETALHNTLAARNFDACLWLIREAGATGPETLVIPLENLLLASPRKFRFRRHDPHFLQACVACADALGAQGRKGAQRAAYALAQALFETDANVQGHVADVLKTLSLDTAKILAHELESRGEWKTESMRLLIDTLGEFPNLDASWALALVLSGRLPRTPRRWTREALKLPLYGVSGIVMLGILSVWMLMLLCSPPAGTILQQILMALKILLTLTVSSRVLAFVGYMAALIFFSLPFRAAIVVWDRDTLEQSAAESLARVGDKNVIPRLIAAAFKGAINKRRACVEAIIALLPLVNEQDANLLSSEQRTRLMRLLVSPDFSSDWKFIRAVLGALHFIGTGDEIPIVTRFAKRGATELIRNEAQLLLPVLEARSKRMRAAETLLRATDAPFLPAEELLRASVPHSSETPENQLLRSIS